MHICVIAEGYPFRDHAHFTFVKQLCVALADSDMKVSVIAPQSITNAYFRHHPFRPGYRKEETDNGNTIEIYSPKIITIGNLTRGCLKNFNDFAFGLGVRRILRAMAEKPDVCYGHFWHSGYAAFPAAKKYGIPLFIASGEAEIELHQKVPAEKLQDFISGVEGVICVSTKNKNESIHAGLAFEDKCIVIPNAIDNRIFHKKNKVELRNRFGYMPDDFIIAFVGGFIHRKGATRIAEAIVRLKDQSIKSIFIGDIQGNDRQYIPECPGILFRGPCEHRQIADYLNCADVFVMPTLHEGCCNANIEAMACGLPIISSDLDFNVDILDSSTAILINPMNIDEIAESIRYFKQHPEVCAIMGNNAINKAKSFNIDERAEKIIKFITSRI